jgi:3-methyl-2-oxobutanoate hydroxymethyltransferase
MSVRLTIRQLLKKADEGQKLTMLTAYDYSLASLIDEAGLDMILVGDSLGMVVLGYEDTLPVTMDDLIRHTQAVIRGAKRALVVADMPFLSYQTSIEDAVRNAGRLLKEGGAQAVKLEGGLAMLSVIRRLVECGIPVMGHIGLTPQSVNQLGGFAVQGRQASGAQKILEEAKAIEEAGAFALTLEGVPWQLAKLVTESIGIPTIGIGAGPYCSGQVLVSYDLLGLFDRFTPKFVKQYANLRETIGSALAEYRKDVESGAFPDLAHSFSMKEEQIKLLGGNGNENPQDSR